jgi:anti-anti-sigma factor
VPAQATIEVRLHSHAASVVTLRGEHDLDSRPGVMLALAAASANGDVLVDLSECSFIDSSIISAFLLAAKRLQERDGALELVIPPDARHLRRILEMTSVQTILPSHDTSDAGIASIVDGRSGVRRAPVDARSAASARKDLRVVSQLIDQLQAKADSTRARRAADRVTVVRAHAVPDPDALAGPADDKPRRRAA